MYCECIDDWINENLHRHISIEREILKFFTSATITPSLVRPANIKNFCLPESKPPNSDFICFVFITFLTSFPSPERLVRRCPPDDRHQRHMFMCSANKSNRAWAPRLSRRCIIS